MTPKIAVQLLVGQNEEPFLPYAIRSVAWADYFTVCNTAPDSENGKANEKIIRGEVSEQNLRYTTLEPDEEGHFSFADARNKCIELTDVDDYILILDSDDVHYPELEKLAKTAIEEGVDALTVYFYHLMVYKNLYQFVQPREILFKRYTDTQFMRGVHEQLSTPKKWPKTAGYWYVHYGYVKPQREVFKRWKFYSDLEGDYHHYDGQNPDGILDDRITVSKDFTLPHPPAIAQYMESYPECPELYRRNPVEETSEVERVGLILITYNDEEFLPECLSTLSQTRTNPDFEVLALDLGSTDKSLYYLEEYSELIEMTIMRADELLPLAETLNEGLNFFRGRGNIQYIGWIHPDMRFEDPYWLHMLHSTLKIYPKVGKVCAANTRDPLPHQMIPGQEQCFIIRKDIINKVGLFDENYKGIGGYEDWDYNRRILNHDGYKCMITPASRVFHHGMGTRAKRNTTADQIANAQYYREKWGTSSPPV